MDDFYDTSEVLSLGNDQVQIDLQPQGGQVKSTVLDHLGTVENTGYSVRFQRLYEVHGQWDSKQPDNASLLVMKMTPRTEDPKDNFKRLSITMTLELHVPKGTRGNHDAPYFASYEPGQEGAWFIKEVSRTRTVTKEAEGNLAGQMPGGPEVGMKLSRSSSEEFERRLIHKIEAKEGWSPTGNASSMRTNRITWTLTPAEQCDGIGDYVIIALLIRRSRATKFQIKVESEANISFFTDSKNKLPWGHKVRLGGFGPAKAPDQLKPDGVKETNLQLVSDQNLLREVAFVHIPEKVAPRSIYGASNTTTVTSTTGTSAVNAVNSTTSSSSISGVRASTQAASARATQTATSTQATVDARVHIPLAVKDADTRIHEHAPLARAPIVPVMEEFLATGAATARGPTFPTFLPGPEPSIPPATSYSRSNARAVRHRRMAALYRRLSQLHMEEADGAEGVPSMESYADKVEREEYI